ncbi:MAG TPA: aldose 1-epimerase [Alphaproteobacteria bacterium]|nr:aldose 1-epimerase [Alphaproteobacteria bacterium]
MFHPPISLTAGPLEITLAPAIGGSIARFTIARAGAVINVMRPAVPEALAARDPLGMSSFPMIPYCGRIARAQFAFGGETYQLDRNFGDSPHAIHGNAWQRPWTVVGHRADKAELVLDHDARERPREWPYSYQARQRFALTPDAFRVDTEVINRDERPMPLSFGLHPYFPVTPQAALTTRLTGMWENDDVMLPCRLAPVPSDLDFSAGRRLADVLVDSCFAGWGGEAVLRWPEAALELRLAAAAPFSQFVVYTPPHRQYFCAEPQSAAPDAINLAGRGIKETGLLVLPPGKAARAETVFIVKTL